MRCFSYQWGYFEVGMYIGGREQRSGVLNDFKLGRLDVGEYPVWSLNRLNICYSLPLGFSHHFLRYSSKRHCILGWPPLVLRYCWRGPQIEKSEFKVDIGILQVRLRISFWTLWNKCVSVYLAQFGTQINALIVIQNKYSEMWTVLDWANPGCVGSKRQREGFVARPLTRGQSKTAKPEEHVDAAVRKSKTKFYWTVLDNNSYLNSLWPEF